MHSVTAISLTIKCRKKKEVLWQLFQWLRSWGGLTNTDSSLIKISVYPGSWWGQLTIYSSSGGSAFNLILLLMTNKHLHITWSSADNWISVPISPSHRELTITSHPIDHLVKLSFFYLLKNDTFYLPGEGEIYIEAPQLGMCILLHNREIWHGLIVSNLF